MPSFNDFITGANNILVSDGILAFADAFTYKDNNAPIANYLISLSWSIHLSNHRTFYDVLDDLTSTGFQKQQVLDLSNNVWKGYCDYKLKNYTNDIQARNSKIYAKIFKWVNQYLYYYTQKYDIKYLVYIGKK